MNHNTIVINSLPLGFEMPKDKYLTCALYKFATLSKYQEMREPLRKKMKSCNVFGTILLANEGINGTIEREELINTEINNHLEQDLKIKNMDKVFQIIIKSAIFEFLYKPNTSIKIIINEYLKASNFFIDDSQTKYLNALLDKISKKIRISNG